MKKFWFYIYLFLILGVICIGVIFMTTSEENNTTQISNGNFNSLVGNEIIGQAINMKDYITQAQAKVSNIITEEIEIPLIIRQYPLGRNILAQATMNNIYNVRGGGLIVLSTVSLADPERWINIIVHEILHVLGIGTSDRWEDSVITIGGEKFLDRILFPKSSREYDFLIQNGLVNGTVGNSIPLSDSVDSFPDGGAHLDELVFDKEVMTPIADDINIISSLSIAMLEDLSFEVDYNYNEDYLL